MEAKNVLLFLAIFCLLQYSIADVSQSGGLSKKRIDRRDTDPKENLQARSENLKARMSDMIQQAETGVEQFSRAVGVGMDTIMKRLVDAGTNMLSRRIEQNQNKPAAQAQA